MALLLQKNVKGMKKIRPIDLIDKKTIIVQKKE